MIPAEWNLQLAAGVPWQEAYPVVEREARAFLSASPIADGGIRTAELIEHLYPERYARGDGIEVRKRMFKALGALRSRGLADCNTKSETPQKLGRTNRDIYPPLWHAPKVRPTCPHCGQVMPRAGKQSS